ncbi:MAG TPA: FAD-dependent monooxygenase [Amaricoccus sp.]|uniref:FAD-dependent monooxygenase n=3 Tax=Amaricoccus sp. TaxID=1872485 RepID=UPI002C48EB03|nr:FAD-dependent monooxygenase [Amaricoccus sp.]HMQ94398.1 FAD-dependent monooxygenase [Amaricoccus sp.]HMR54488.1 FAD-dependent monooxygenase [Amaricoccus sp.]HMU01513.1 FAD-dependent monooxygenase [Amaricoccus sp.]
MLPNRTEVLIVGAGPTGLALAVSLRQAGVDHLLIDRLPQGQNTSRAAVIHAHTLETLEPLGVTEALIARGLKLRRFAIRDRDHARLQLRFDNLPSSYPYILMLPQDETERVLGARLAALGGEVHRGVTATAATQGPAGARVTVASAEGEQEIEARYVVAGDGMRSLVREAAGIGFDGEPHEGSFVLADVRMRWALGRDEVSLFFSPGGMVVVAPLPNGSFRVVAAMEDAPELPGPADIQALVDARGPTAGENRVEEVLWSSRFRLHHRIARSYRAGRFLLMGDAAHVHSPAGGQGMNTGIVDAVVLGRMLAEVVTGNRPDAWLDRYGELRRPAAAEVIALASRLTAMATTRGAARQTLRNAMLSLVGALPPARHRVEMSLSGLARRDATRLAA